MRSWMLEISATTLNCPSAMHSTAGPFSRQRCLGHMIMGPSFCGVGIPIAWGWLWGYFPGYLRSYVSWAEVSLQHKHL